MVIAGSYKLQLYQQIRIILKFTNDRNRIRRVRGGAPYSLNTYCDYTHRYNFHYMRLTT